MKKYISFALVFLISLPCFAMDTKLGSIKLTKTQVENISYLEKPEPFKGFSFHGNGMVVGVSDSLPSSEQVENAKVWFDAIPVEPLKEASVASFDIKVFFGRILMEIPAERWFELSKLGIGWTMQQLAEYPNFSGLKDYLNGLEMDGTLNSEDAQAIKRVLLEQKINLDDF